MPRISHLSSISNKSSNKASSSPPSVINSTNFNEISVPKRGYRIAEAAAYMGVSPWFVELKIRSGELAALRLCRHYTILKEDMDKFLDKQRATIERQKDCAA